MTDLDEIEKACKELRPSLCCAHAAMKEQLCADCWKLLGKVPALVAEVRRLRAQQEAWAIEELHGPGRVQKDRAELRATRAEVERLAKAVEEAAEWIAEGEDFQRTMGWHKAADKDVEFATKLRAALAPPTTGDGA